MREPLVSVVIPTYNRASLVQRAIESVRQQTYENLEIIVVDDSSTDETPEVVPTIDDPRVEYVRHETNRHGAAARNTGVKYASGEYVAFLDDDDEWYPKKIEKQVKALDESPEEVAMIYCWADVYREGHTNNPVAASEPTVSGEIFEETLTSNPIGATSTLVIDSEALETVGGFDEDLERGQDSDLIRRIAANYRVDYVPERLVRHWIHDEGRIQDDSIENLHASIECFRKTLDEFSDYLSDAPEQNAQIRLNIANAYAKTGELAACVSWTASAVRTSPLSASVYRRVASIGFQASRSVLHRGTSVVQPPVR